jgi:hypothetical protein
LNKLSPISRGRRKESCVYGYVPGWSVGFLWPPE